MHGIQLYAWVHIFWWCRLVASSSWLAIPPACSSGPLPLPPLPLSAVNYEAVEALWSKLQRPLWFSITYTFSLHVHKIYSTRIKNCWCNHVPQIWDQNQCIATRPMVDCFDSVDKTNATEKGFIGRLGCMHQSESPSWYWEISTAVLKQAKRDYLLGPCLNSEPELLEVT